MLHAGKVVFNGSVKEFQKSKHLLVQEQKVMLSLHLAEQFGIESAGVGTACQTKQRALFRRFYVPTLG
jgi:hypothetical protein